MATQPVRGVAIQRTKRFGNPSFAAQAVLAQVLQEDSCGRAYSYEVTRKCAGGLILI